MVSKTNMTKVQPFFEALNWNPPKFVPTLSSEEQLIFLEEQDGMAELHLLHEPRNPAFFRKNCGYPHDKNTNCESLCNLNSNVDCLALCCLHIL